MQKKNFQDCNIVDIFMILNDFSPIIILCLSLRAFTTPSHVFLESF